MFKGNIIKRCAYRAPATRHMSCVALLITINICKGTIISVKYSTLSESHAVPVVKICSK